MDNGKWTEHGYSMPLVCYAVLAKKLDLLCCLITEGAEINAVDDAGYCALHYAVVHGNAEIVALLMDAGADPKLKNNVGESSIELSRRLDHSLEITCLLTGDTEDCEIE